VESRAHAEPHSDASAMTVEAVVAASDELTRLIAEGHEHGTLRLEAIATALEDAELGREQVADVCVYIEEQGI